ncbi:hypothetical protein ABPG72_014520 [Tetrahymena utriculariae]
MSKEAQRAIQKLYIAIYVAHLDAHRQFGVQTNQKHQIDAFIKSTRQDKARQGKRRQDKTLTRTWTSSTNGVKDQVVTFKGVNLSVFPPSTKKKKTLVQSKGGPNFVGNDFQRGSYQQIRD